MARTTSANVQGIISIKSGTDLDPFINAANSVVTSACSNSSYSATTLELIERWLAAHFYTVYDPRKESSKVGDGSVKYEGRTEMGFNSSKYGQMAMRIDTAGNLAALDKKTTEGIGNILSLTWLGAEEDELPLSD